MSNTNHRRKNWPMEYILGGIFLLAVIVLVVHGISRVSEDKARQAGAALEGLATSERAEAAPHRLPAPESPAPSAGDAEEAIAIEAQASSSPAAGMRNAPGTIAEAKTGEPTVAEDARGDYQLGETLYAEREYPRAAAEFRAYTLRYPHNAWGHYMLGLSEWKAGEAASAELSLRRSLEENPEQFKTLVNLARVLMDLGRNGDALDCVDQAIALDGTSCAAWRVRGRALHNLGRADQALEAYHRALALDPADVWSLNNLGLVLIQSGRFEEALGPLALATRMDSANAVFQNNLGVALERRGYLIDAKDAYALACAADAGHEKAPVSLARVETRLSELNSVESAEGSTAPASVAPMRKVDLAALAERFALGLASGDLASSKSAHAEGESAAPSSEESAQTALLETDK